MLSCGLLLSGRLSNGSGRASEMLVWVWLRTHLGYLLASPAPTADGTYSFSRLPFERRHILCEPLTTQTSPGTWPPCRSPPECRHFDGAGMDLCRQACPLFDKTRTADAIIAGVATVMDRSSCTSFVFLGSDQFKGLLLTCLVELSSEVPSSHRPQDFGHQHHAARRHDTQTRASVFFVPANIAAFASPENRQGEIRRLRKRWPPSSVRPSPVRQRQLSGSTRRADSLSARGGTRAACVPVDPDVVFGPTREVFDDDEGHGLHQAPRRRPSNFPCKRAEDWTAADADEPVPSEPPPLPAPSAPPLLEDLANNQLSLVAQRHAAFQVRTPALTKTPFFNGSRSPQKKTVVCVFFFLQKFAFTHASPLLQGPSCSSCLSCEQICVRRKSLFVA